jgi:hypothetical protein
VDAEFGIDPESATEPVELDAAAAGADLRRWLHSSLDGLAGARS